MSDVAPPAPPSPLGWLDSADVLAHMKLPAGTTTADLPRYVDAAEWLVARSCYVPDDPKTDAPDLYNAAVLVAADLWADRQTTGGAQSGGPDMGWFNLGDFSEHVRRLTNPYRRWSEMIG